jgi:ankyrin repeat protein
MENIVHEIASKLIEIHNQLKFFHWQTTSYARHQAYGGVYDSMTGLIDSFVETMMGKYGRVPALPMHVYNRNEKDCMTFIDETVAFLLSLSNVLSPSNDTDLLNIRDEMLGEFNKLKYLLTLK